MPQVDFYLLTAQTQQKTALFTCRLLEKAYQQGRQSYVLCDNANQQQRLNELLWVFRDESFVPHAILESNTPATTPTLDTKPVATPILLGTADDTPPTQDVLINLLQYVPDYFQSFKRVVEIVMNTPEHKQAARERFRHYRQHDLTPTMHRL